MCIHVFEVAAWRIDTEVWWWWVPFYAMGLLTALLTIRKRDRRPFWNTAVGLSCLLAVVSAWLPNRLG